MNKILPRKTAWATVIGLGLLACHGPTQAAYAPGSIPPAGSANGQIVQWSTAANGGTGGFVISNLLVSIPANEVLAGPSSGLAASPAFRALATADLPTTSVTPGSYTSTNLTVDATGRITAASNGAGGGGGSLPSGTSGQTLYYNGTVLTPTSSLTNDGMGNIGLGASGSPTSLSTPGNEMVLQETGDQYGTVKLHLQNRNGLNGALFENTSLSLVDFGFNAQGVQRNMRFEARGGNFVTGDPEFEFFDPNTNFQMMEISDKAVQTNAPTKVNATFLGLGTGQFNDTLTLNAHSGGIGLLVNGASGQTGSLLEWRNSSGSQLGKVSATGVLTAPAVLTAFRTVSTATDTATVTDTTIELDATNNTITETMPTPIPTDRGHIYNLVKVDATANSVTVSANVLTSPSLILTTQGQVLRVLDDGNRYIKLN